MVDSAQKEAWLAGGGGYNRWTSATDGMTAGFRCACGLAAGRYSYKPCIQESTIPRLHTLTTLLQCIASDLHGSPCHPT